MASYLVMKNNLLRSINRKVVFLISFLLPMLLCMLSGAINQLSETSVRIGVLGLKEVTKEEKEQTEMILKKSRNVSFAEADEKCRNTDLILGKYQLVIDVSDLFEKGELTTDSNYSKDYEDSMKQVFESAILSKKAADLSIFDEGGTTKEERAVAFLVTIFLIFATLYMSEAIKDKARGVTERVSYSPASRFSYGWGYDAYVFIMVKVQAVLACIVMQLLYHPSDNLLWILVIPIFIALVSTVYAKIICKITNSDASANITSSSLAAVCSLIGGTFIAVEHMPKILQYASVIRFAGGWS